MVINASEVKTKGVSLFGSLLSKFDELIISVRGKERYVVIDIERYKKFRENELDIAYVKTMQDIKNRKNIKTQKRNQNT